MGSASRRSDGIPALRCPPEVRFVPTSAETYLRATNEQGHFAQMKVAVCWKVRGELSEPQEVTIREETNAASLPKLSNCQWACYLNEVWRSGRRGGSIARAGGRGDLHWDTYMPYVNNDNWANYDPGRAQFAAGLFTSDKDTLAGDRSSEYDGVRIFPRLEALGFPNPGALKRCTRPVVQDAVVVAQ